MTRSSRIQGNLEAELLASAGEFGTGAASSKSGSEISNVKPSLNAKQPIMPLVIRPPPLQPYTHHGWDEDEWPRKTSVSARAENPELCGEA
ncbi:unnamed protein product, partial [Clonostachys chloroleuca]